jgi:inhibitor of KinA sporulation pathway (predicted exonuclease)
LYTPKKNNFTIRIKCFYKNLYELSRFALLWKFFSGYGLDKKTPDHSVTSKARLPWKLKVVTEDQPDARTKVKAFTDNNFGLKMTSAC